MASNLFDFDGIALTDVLGDAVLSKGTTVPADATAGYVTGAIFLHTDGGAGTAQYVNEGTIASSAFKQSSPIKTKEFALTKANILAMNGAPVEVLAAQGAGTAIEFVSATVIYDYATATYTGGGAVTLRFTGGSTISSDVSAANSFGAAGDKVTNCVMLDTTAGIPLLSNTGLSITNATAAFADPGTAAGVGRINIVYRVISTGL